MKNSLMHAIFLAAIGIFLANTEFAQNDRVIAAAGDQYVISAKAGGVNYVEGRVAVFRIDGTNGYLVKGDELQIGDRVSTGSDGKAEILLNPGSYVRLGNNTAFEFIATALDDVKLKLTTGSAIFEVLAADEFRVSIRMPRTEIDLTRSGVFRLDVMRDGSSKVSVFKGKVYVGPGDRTEVESGRTAIIIGNQVSVAKFDRDTKDVLDLWSKARAKELSRINAQLQRNSLRNSLLNSYNQQGWNLYNSFGVWVFDPARRTWCFLPFGSGWGSPYGWGYDFDLWDCRLPSWFYWNGPAWNPPPPTSGGGSTTPAVTPIATAGDRSPVPPFVRMGGDGGGRTGSGRSIDDSSGGSTPTWNPPPPSSPPPSSPPPSTTREGSGAKKP